MNLTHWLKRLDRGASATPKGKPRLRLESLEAREVPAAIDFNPGTGALTLNGTAGTDSIRIDQAGANTLIFVNDQSATFAPGAVKQVNVFAGSGDDLVVVFASSGFPVDVQAQGGDDRISVNLAQVNGYVNVSGGETGSNFLNVIDYDNDADTTYSLSAGLLTREINSTQAASSVQYSGVRTVYLSGGDGDNNYKLEGTSAPRVFVAAGKGDDAFEVAPSAQNLDAVAGASEINFLGGPGLDRLIAYDSLNNQGATYNLRIENSFDDSLRRTGSKSVTVTHTDFDILIVKGGSGSNTWNVNSHSSETYLGGSTGSDHFVVGDEFDRLGSAFLGLVGGGGFDSATLYDSSQISPKTYELVQSTLTHRPSNSTAASTIVLSDIDNTTLFGGSGANTYNVSDVAANTQFTLFAGEGNDTIRVGGSSGLHTVNGTLNVFAGGGFNSMDVVDTPNGYAGTTYTLTNSKLTRKINSLAPVEINFADVDDLDLFGGSAANTYDVQGVAAITDLTIDGGAKNDLFRFGAANNMNGLFGTVTVNGNGGFDSLAALDSANTAPTTYSLSAAVLTRQINGQQNQAQVSYNGVEDVDIVGGSASNTFNVQSTNAGVNNSVVGGAGDDRFRFGLVDLDLVDGFVSVTGNGGSDTIELRDEPQTEATTYRVDAFNLKRFVPGVAGTTEVGYAGVESVKVFAGSGANTFDVRATLAGVSTALVGGSANDTFRLAGSNNLNAIAGFVSANGGGGGVDRLEVHDEGQTAGSTYQVDATSFKRFGPATAQVGFVSVEDLTVFGGSGPNTWNVLATGANTHVTLEGGSDADRVNIATNDLDTIAGFVSANGRGGPDTLYIHDEAQTTASTYQVGATNIERFVPGVAGNAGVGYTGFEQVSVLGGSGSDTFSVFSTEVGTKTFLLGNDGNDAFQFAPGSGNLSGIDGETTADGGAGTDSLLVNDSANAVQTEYNLGVDRLSRIIGSSAARINMDGLESATVLGGSAGNTYNALNTDPAMPVEFRAGNGADTFHVSPVSQTLRTIPSGVSFVGGGGSDTVVIHDELNPHAATYLLSADRLVRKVVGQEDTTVHFSGHEKLIINAGTGDDVLTVADAAALAVPVVFNAGAGNDVLKGALGAENTFEVTGPNAGQLTIAGGASALQFSNTENLVGGDRNDRFRFTGAGELAGVADGGFGSDTLDYSALTTGVVVDLSAGTATRARNVGSIENVFGGSGDDNVRGSDLDNVLMGNGGNDVLAGAAGNDILVGGDGSDTINGGAGRNVLIGGRGGDAITGGSDEDLLIAGYTAFDNNVPALRSIMAEWASAAPTATRVGHLQGTIQGGLNSVFLIAGPDPQVPPGGIIPDPRSVFDDGVRDIITGAAGTDWFFFSPNDSADIVAGEFGTDTGDGTI